MNRRSPYPLLGTSVCLTVIHLVAVARMLGACPATSRWTYRATRQKRRVTW
jgi:hypothetical protein